MIMKRLHPRSHAPFLIGILAVFLLSFIPATLFWADQASRSLRESELLDEKDREITELEVRLSTERANLTSEILTVKKALTDLEEKNKQLRASQMNDEKEREINELEVRLSTERANLTSEILTVKKALTDLEEKNKRLRASRERFNERVIRLTDGIGYTYELSAIVMFRVNFQNDMLHFTDAEVRQWMAYMSHAGVEHFFAYDNCQEDAECQTWLSDLADKEPTLVTYVRWPPGNATWSSDKYMENQKRAYMDHIQRRAGLSRYEIICDIDEYPFMPQDAERNFLLRFAQTMADDQTLIQTLFFGGEPDTNHTWRALRYLSRERQVFEQTKQSPRTKYIYKTAMVDTVFDVNDNLIHWLPMAPWSKTQVQRMKQKADDPSVLKLKADPSIIRLNHYWCERVTNTTLLIHDDTIRKVVDQVMNDTTLLERFAF